MNDSEAVRQLVTAALWEDLGERGDITSKLFIPERSKSLGRVITREPIVVAGLAAAKEVAHQVDPEMSISFLTKEGADLAPGETLLTLEGSTHSLLTTERTLLNFLERLCGVATQTRKYVEAVAGYQVTLLDTRKMTPGWRQLEKAAVIAGGASNHRIGLFDAILVKDNHLAALLQESSEAGEISGTLVSLKEGSIEKLCPLLAAKLATLREEHPTLKVELEADTLEQAALFLSFPEIDTILLDNMKEDQLRAAVKLRQQMAPQITLEASGGITLENLASVASTGVDFISLGALTHSALWSDLSLELVTL